MERDKAVDVSLLVYEVAYKRMYLAVYERVCLEYVGMAAMRIGRLALAQDMPEWRKVVEIPIVVHEPLCADKRYVVLVHACRKPLLEAAAVFCLYLFCVVRHFYLEELTAVVVVAAVARLAFLAPHFYHSATGIV